MPRYETLTPEQMTPEQRKVVENVTAASALVGKVVTLSRLRGQVIAFANTGNQQGMVTIHPSSILRAPDEAGRRAAYAGLVKDLKHAVKAATP